MDEYQKRAARKARNVKHHLKHFENRRGPEEHKRLKERARQRQQQTGKGSRRRRREWDADAEDLPATERMSAWRDETGAAGAKGRAGAGRAGAGGAGTVAESGDGEPGVAATSDEAAAHAPIVVGVARGRVRLRDTEGREVDVPLAAHLAAVQSSAVAVGDRVVLEGAETEGVRVGEVLPRHSVLARPDPSHRGRERALAANVDVGVVVVTARPLPKTGLVDRLLVALQRGGVQPVIALNKVDLLEPAERADVLERLQPYRDLGLDCPAVSATTGAGIGVLAACLAGRTAVLVGHSGVGKSSLLNALVPGTDLPTGAVRAGDGKGRHTTTSSSLLDLGDGTRLIDTPGVRAFGLFRWDLPLLREAFPEVEERAAACRFSNCRHRAEPGCAVRAAVELGELSAARFASWLRLLASFEAD